MNEITLDVFTIQSHLLYSNQLDVSTRIDLSNLLFRPVYDINIRFIRISYYE